jgi:hypothetical protein
MSNDTTNEEYSPEDNEVIRELRAQLKTANANVKTAGQIAVALVERGTLAAGLMPEGFKGVADIFAKEVDGELNADNAAEWLRSRGFSASPNQAQAEEAQRASDLSAVTDLGGAVAAAGSLTPEDSIARRLEEVRNDKNLHTLPDVTAAIAAALAG